MTTDTSTTHGIDPRPDPATATGILLPVPSRGLDDAALDAAADEARARGCGIALVHVVHVTVGVPASSDQVHEVDSSLAEVGHAVLTAAATGLRERLGDAVPITSELFFGPVVPTLVQRSADAELVLVPRRDLGRLERLVTSSVSHGVAARAHVPVLSVPPGWRRSPTRPRIVTAAVDHPETSGAAEIGLALERAAATGAALHVLRAAWVPQPYQGVVFQDQTREELLVEARRELDGRHPPPGGGPPRGRRDVGRRVGAPGRRAGARLAPLGAAGARSPAPVAADRQPPRPRDPQRAAARRGPGARRRAGGVTRGLGSSPVLRTRACPDPYSQENLKKEVPRG